MQEHSALVPIRWTVEDSRVWVFVRIFLTGYLAGSHAREMDRFLTRADVQRLRQDRRLASDFLTPEDVERLRRERGLSITDFCHHAGVASTIFTRWKSGRYEPTMSNYRKMRDALRSFPVLDTPKVVPKRLAIVEAAPYKPPRSRRRDQVVL